MSCFARVYGIRDAWVRRAPCKVRVLRTIDIITLLSDVLTHFFKSVAVYTAAGVLGKFCPRQAH